MILESLPEVAAEGIADVYAALAQDGRPERLDLGIGVYRDSSGHSPILECVRRAQSVLRAKETTKDYRSPSGNREYCEAIERLVLGADHTALREGRVITLQTPGAGGALRAGGELLELSTRTTLWIPEPTWDQQLLIFGAAGLNLQPYPYYDRASNRLQLEPMLDRLRTARRGDAVLLHGCCHNPTGADPTREGWAAIADVCAQQGLIPFVDLVYQGFASGIDEDAWATRLLADRVPEMLLATSSSKSFGLYRERAGTLSVLSTKRAQHGVRAERHLSRIVRSLYFMPPDSGAATVVEILGDAVLRNQWHAELDAMRRRIITVRGAFADALRRVSDREQYEYLRTQNGMFSLLPLGPSAVVELRREHAIYMMPDARINLAALNIGSIERVARAVVAAQRAGG
ncbi:MAG: aromatic amino acid transaminase [Proteobacteria bacterium]|nr:aromatic amino acid transaminase [Pseudomonadota bacterium]